ncbi:hypothetical protein BFP77_05085 [Maribacter sp. 4U21]|uniref:DUF6503 family protein n=1 Tax=Maribacter sp. 4U21 TaxID=1889779 RepID=UPI000C1553BF|nr:DUF6503 family protein [Maribacter sp. 4U21]PIB29997.1 hypothetical protein BFP77_05085 [Maribacter sp. 4U21]
MKKIVYVVLFLTSLACKEQVKPVEKQEEQKEEIVALNDFPEALRKVFDAHGGLDIWEKQRTLVFDLPKPDARETHTVDLISRKDKITTTNFSIGFDGQHVWLLDMDKSYNGDAVFYHNLMFYFYAMPFVLADDGINYGATEDLEFEGVSYPGIRISYDNGVGASSKDEYYLHYHPETFQMQWLGYTVTYRSGEVSDNVKWIRYADWMDINGIVLPKSITWYNYEGKTIKEEKSTVTFENIELSTKKKGATFYQKPEEAAYVTKE